MQVPDEELILPLITKPKKISCKKLHEDQSVDYSNQQPEQTSNQTQRQIDTKQQIDLSNNVQGDIKNIKKQERQKKGKNKSNNNKKKMSTSNKQQKKEKFNCRFYMQGSCKNGTKCKFTHPVEFQATINEPTKPKQPKLEPYPNIKKQSSTQLKQQPYEPIKFPKDLYFERMVDTMKQSCYSCKTREILVTLSCGCHTICELCVKSRMACSKENHPYDDKFYIK